MKSEIYPCIWFDKNASEAAQYYSSVFGNSEIISEDPVVVTITSHGDKFILINGGPIFKPNPSISFYVICDSDEEVLNYHEKLSESGKIMMPLDNYDWSELYSFVEDKFGVSWQILKWKFANIGKKFIPSFIFTGSKNGFAESAINYWTEIFQNSSIDGILKYGKDSGEVEGNVMHAQFKLNGNTMMAMDSSYNHNFDFNDAISFVVECDNQAEIDYLWDKLTNEGKESECGWLKDKYGVSWQIIPTILSELMADPDRRARVVQAFLKMKKFDIASLLLA